MSVTSSEPIKLDTVVIPNEEGRHHDRRRRAAQRIGWIANFMDSSIKLPFVNYSIGFDGIIGLIPGIGDAFSAVLSGYSIYEARQAGVSRKTQTKMLGFLLLDLVVGAIPIVGDWFDFVYKSNLRSARAALKELSRNR